MRGNLDHVRKPHSVWHDTRDPPRPRRWCQLWMRLQQTQEGGRAPVQGPEATMQDWARAASVPPPIAGLPVPQPIAVPARSDGPRGGGWSPRNHAQARASCSHQNGFHHVHTHGPWRSPLCKGVPETQRSGDGSSTLYGSRLWGREGLRSVGTLTQSPPKCSHGTVPAHRQLLSRPSVTAPLPRGHPVPTAPRGPPRPDFHHLHPVASAGTWDRGGPTATLGWLPLLSERCAAGPCRCRGQRFLVVADPG